MGSSGTGDPGQTFQQISGKRRNRRIIALLAILIAASMVFAGFVLTNEVASSVYLKTGDYVNYALNASVNGTSYDVELNYTVTYRDSLAIDTMGYSCGYVDTGDFGPFPYSNQHPWTWVGDEMISTSFGEKCVKILWYFDMTKDMLLILNTGVDSSLPYRETMTNTTSSDHYSILISQTNNTQIASADSVMRSADIKGFNAPTNDLGTPTGYSGPDRGRGGSYVSGSLEAKSGDHIRYNATGNDTTVFFFSLNDFKNIERTDQFVCNATLSKLANISMEIDQPVGPGTYWYFVAMRDSGLFYYYWH